MKSTNCPDCGKSLRTRGRCACGWRIDTEDEAVTDDRCHYQFQGKRCPLPGTFSSSLYGKNVTWNCIYHSQHSSVNASQKDNCLNDINYDEYMKKRIDWRRALFPEEQQVVKKKSNK